MTKIPLKLKECQLNYITVENDQNTPTTQKNGWNTLEARKITEIPLKPKKRPQYPWILRKHQNWRKYNVLFSENEWNTPKTKRRPTYPTNSKNGWDTPTTQKMTEIPSKQDK